MKETYEIPEQNLTKLQDKLDKLNRKASKLETTPIILEEISFRDEPILDEKGKETGRIQRYITVTIEGEAPTIGGWKFVSTIQHEAEGNILRTVPSETIPEIYRTSPANCDHCQTIRDRKDTYIVTNGQEFKQVGSGCLRDFTGVNNPHKAAAYAYRETNADQIPECDCCFSYREVHSVCRLFVILATRGCVYACQ